MTFDVFPRSCQNRRTIKIHSVSRIHFTHGKIANKTTSAHKMSTVNLNLPVSARLWKWEKHMKSGYVYCFYCIFAAQYLLSFGVRTFRNNKKSSACFVGGVLRFMSWWCVADYSVCWGSWVDDVLQITPCRKVQRSVSSRRVLVRTRVNLVSVSSRET